MNQVEKDIVLKITKMVFGQDFWHRLTGDKDFYTDLIHAIGKVAAEADFSEELKEVIQELAKTPEVKRLSI